MKILACTFLLLCFSISARSNTRIACIGASITYGAFIENRELNSFPGQLQQLLGKNYTVNNFGVGGTTMLRNGNNSYWSVKEFQEALKSNPDIVFIDLGGNDSKLINRKYLDELSRNCMDMIDSFQLLASHPRIVILLPVVSFVTDSTGIWDSVIVHQVIPELRQAAYLKNVEVLDMHPLLINHKELMPDGIHPNLKGSAIMANRLYKFLMQSRDRDFDISVHLPAPISLSSFFGYRCFDFTLNGRSCKVVRPKQAANTHPWIWRARFWAHEPQTDITLLEQGFHVVYCDVVEMFGNDQANQYWNDFYNLLFSAGLKKTTVLEGMSRGGIYVFNWAAVNPDKVACVYVDNPVLDMKSWPCGLLSRPAGEAEFSLFKEDFHLTTQEQVYQFKGSPIDKIDQIVKGNYPILILCADDDEAVPPDENTLPFEKKIKAMNGNITVIHKPGFKHHPHSLPNPSPIVDFILHATN